MKILRLLLFEDCNRMCEGCCNKDFDLKNLPLIKDYSDYNEIILTGGEPMLKPELVIHTVQDIKAKRKEHVPVYVYTAKVDDIVAIFNVLEIADGITVTLHEQKDVNPFMLLNDLLHFTLFEYKSLRLNIFEGIDLGKIDLRQWKVKKNIKWIKDCPLPKNETLMRLTK